jgi:hypothetical protein
MAIEAGCYSMNIGCDTHVYTSISVTGRNFTEALREAKAAGWRFAGTGWDRKVLCPTCARERGKGK